MYSSSLLSTHEHILLSAHVRLVIPGLVYKVSGDGGDDDSKIGPYFGIMWSLFGPYFSKKWSLFGL